MARPGPDPAHCIRAFELLSEGNSLPATVEILAQPEAKGGIGKRVAIETVRRWAKIGARASSWWQERHEVAEENTTQEFVRQKYANFLDNLIARGFAELDKGDAAYKDVAPIMGRLAKEQTLALGGYAAAKLDVTGNLSGELDPQTLAVVKEYERRAAEREQEIRNSGGTER